MDALNDDKHEAVPSLVTTVLGHPYISALILFTIACVITRIKTNKAARYDSLEGNGGEPRPVPVVPYSVPIAGHTFEFATKFQDFLKQKAYQIPSGIFALKIAGGTHNIIVSHSLTKELFNRVLPIDSSSLIWRFLEQTFGDNGLHRAWNDEAPNDLQDVAGLLHGLMKEPFLSNGIKNVVNAVEEKTWNLISGTSSWVDHSRWERSGQVEIVSASPKDGTFVAEVDLFGLTRNFVGEIASTLLMGHAFLENNPSILEDLWRFDSKAHIMMMGLPSWMLPGVPPAVGARERCIEAIREHHRAMFDLIEGKDPGYRYSDLSDVSDLVWERARGFHKLKNVPRAYGIGDLILLWAMNVNANQVVFWMLFFIYKKPDLLQDIREEISPYVKLRQAESDGLPIKAAPRLSIEIEALMQKCPLLKGAFFETMRMEVIASSYRVAQDDFVLSESKEDARRFGKAQPDKYLIKKGDILAVTPQVQNFHPRYYDKPEEFNARRFWIETKDEKGEEKISVEYGTMRPWGGGSQMCKGRNFAEREVMAFVAGILTVWEMEPVKKDGWKHPGNQVTTGTFIPAKDVRMRMWRRKGL